MRARALRRLLGCALLTPWLLALADEDVSRGDAGWRARAEGAIEGSPLPGPIEDSIAAYERALARRPESLSARWKLLRSIHFAGRFLAEDPAEQRRRYEQAARVAGEGQALLAAELGGPAPPDELEAEALRASLARTGVPAEDVARLYFWSAINWGSWSRTVGLLATVQQGVANRLHRYARVTLALEPDYEDGGAYRLLGRLHAKLPRLPFVSGWVDRDRALPLVERGYAIAPEHPGNRLLLALTLLDLAPDRREEAVALLRGVGTLEPRPATQVEDLTIRREARDQLAEIRTAAPN